MMNIFRRVASRRWYASRVDSMLANVSAYPTVTPPSSSGSVSLPSASGRCLLFDKLGKHRILSSRSIVSKLLEKHELLPRDLRKIDKGYDDIVPLIIIRDDSILLSISHIRALIKSDEIVVFNYDGSYSSIHLLNSLKESLDPGAVETNLINDNDEVNHPLDYEIRALNSVFAEIVDHLQSEMKVHVTVINGILKELEDDVDLTKLKYLLIVSKKLQVYIQKATLIRNLIDELLDQDEELNELYLTSKRMNKPRTKDDHREVEFLLENYSLQCDAIVQTAESRLNDVKTTEEIIAIVLDSNRNDLMLLNLKFSITLLSLACLLFFAATYGMNLENFIEEKNGWFYAVCTGFTMLSVLMFYFSNRKLVRLQKIQLSS